MGGDMGTLVSLVELRRHAERQADVKGPIQCDAGIILSHNLSSEPESSRLE